VPSFQQPKTAVVVGEYRFILDAGRWRCMIAL
jgi:hypothetical protein